MHRSVFVLPRSVFLTVGETQESVSRMRSSVPDPARGEKWIWCSRLNTWGWTTIRRISSCLKGRTCGCQTWLATLRPGRKGWARSGGTLYFENHDQPRSVSRWGDDAPGGGDQRKRSWACCAHRELRMCIRARTWNDQRGWHSLDQFRDLEVLKRCGARGRKALLIFYLVSRA